MPTRQGDRRPKSSLTVTTPSLLAAALVAGLLGAAPASADTDGLADLRADLDALLADPSLAGGTSGVVVRSLDNGEVLYRNEPDASLLPASNNKLLTTAAALDVLGTDHRFSTRVVAASRPRHGTLRGDLHLVGTGDPSLTVEVFDRLAADVAAAGVTTVTGDLVADDSWFDDQRLPSDWEEGDLQYYYAPQISALTPAANADLDTGVVAVRITPGESAGDPVTTALEPATDYVSVDNRATTGDPWSVGVDRALGGNTITVTGAMPPGDQGFTTMRTVHEPTGYAADLFARALADHGVEVRGDAVRGEAPGDAVAVARHDSAELGELLVPLLKLSNNGHAEILVKAIDRETGGDGGWEDGLSEVELALTRIGLDTSDLELTDGSGLSRGNRLSAGLLADLLEEAPDEPWFAAWSAALPVAGVDGRLEGGTLENRMRGTSAEGNVRAKTGTLTAASALSGYVTGADGESLLFSVVNNGYTGAAPRPVQDAIAVRLADFSRTAPTSDATAGAVPRQRLLSDPAADHLECSWVEAC
ncbi:D-alanyl-D-alanine carboxypeptidase/D-alanyl-D-alanine endopeptidase [Actinorugispora endophytica]|uniref:D-alanyl-D-alanine carboxypeptidase/D-alanyl-D-alanine-endopeptidase (Penicillin-binding protein 4) n=1 Tax=Actinorugispora endophytica TaxID=1605990 RepID=A0A4R6V5W7_9ACTN|nr:D-alanyl-D-alanine carboxypeptidase/D-alanyl-D-alanine-endopeptidase [Actinorugispora endophytica]TDQ53798.1 D-alanyl-D-alanine carboxypeptidase/D-alanyl-D-alanine-endopeptidase (penicillin-binding protein 4) [Actinorugispora endophytica]